MVREIYVAPNGNDAGSGTLDQPFRSIQTALGRVNNGEGGNVFLRGGSYSLDEPVRISDNEGGSSTTRLVVQNYQNEKVFIDGSKLAADKLPSIAISSASAVDVQGLEIFGSYGGISIVGAASDIGIRNNIVRDVEFSGIAAFGAELKGIKDIKVEGNQVFRTNLFNKDRPIVSDNNAGWGSGIVFSRTDGGIISNNTVYDNYGEGIALTLANGAIASNNTVYDNFSVGMYMDNATNSTFENNFIYNTGNQEFYRRFTTGEEAAIGIQLANEIYPDANPLFGDVIRNNIVVGGDRLFNYGNFDVGGGLKNVSVLNNTFYGNATTKKIVSIEAAPHLNTVFSNNIFSKENPAQAIVLPADLQGLSFATNLWFGGSAGAAASDTDVTTNPLLANPGGLAPQDYQLLAGSPAVDRGVTTTLVPKDFLGGNRPVNAFDIGAYEVAGLPNAAPAPTPAPIEVPPLTPPELVPPAPEPLPTTPPVVEAPPVLELPPIAPPIVVPPIVVPPIVETPAPIVAVPEHITVNIPINAPVKANAHCPKRFRSLSVDLQSLKSLKDVKSLKDLKDVKVKVELHQ
jgi:parallel beta-helix repeat protein